LQIKIGRNFLPHRRAIRLMIQTQMMLVLLLLLLLLMMMMRILRSLLHAAAAESISFNGVG